MDIIINDIKEEYRFATNKFKGNKQKLAALMEEVGELSQALIDHDLGKKLAIDVYKEAVQVAATAIQIALKGSQEFTYKCPNRTKFEDFPDDYEV